jgi:PKD repeat protein
MRSTGWILAAGVVLLAACGGDNGGDIQGPSTNPPPPPENMPPTANFGVSCAQLVCTFTDSSNDPDGSIKSWNWDFGDGSTAPDQNPVHTYAAAQTYNVVLTVTDSAGATGTVTKPAEPQAPTADLVCTDATAAGGVATCSVTLPVAAAVRAVVDDHVPCEAVGDVFAFSAPVVDTLTADGCVAPAGTQVELPSSPAGTTVTFEIKSGLAQYMTAVHISGQYPEWTLNVEDAVGAPFPPDFVDMIVTLTVVPGGP